MISIIVPVYKVEDYLRESVDSILAQTYKDLEVILVDDGSPDNCGKICDEYAEKDPRVKVIHSENGGLSAARNRGMEIAKGEYIGFIDSDDWIDNDMFEVLMQNLKTTGADICICGFHQDGPGSSKVRSIAEDEVILPQDAVKGIIRGKYSSVVWNRLYKRKCLEDLKFPEGNVYEDVLISCRMLMKADKVSVSSAHPYHYRIRPRSITATNSMDTVKDYCIAHYLRYKEISENPLFSEDKEFMEQLTVSLIEAAELVWSWMHKMPGKERDHTFMKEAASTLREIIPYPRQKHLSPRLKISLFFCRRASAFHYFAMYHLHKWHVFVWEHFKREKQKPEAK